jgi:hypothetical protein
VIKLAVALLFASVVLAGCTLFGDLGTGRAGPGVNRVCGPDVHKLPCGKGMKEGTVYSFQLLTHCGIEYAYLDGRFWLANPRLGDRAGNPPPGWGNPVDEGTVVLASADVAVFTNESGHQMRFQPAPGSYRPPPCA